MGENISVSLSNIDKELWWKAKALASSKQITMRELVINLLKQETEDNGK
jgi:hypothetical protein